VEGLISAVSFGRAAIVLSLVLLSTPTLPQQTAAAPPQNQVLPAERGEFVEAARTAWRFGERYYPPSTGLIAPVPFYDYSTVWDLGSSLAMLYAARDLGFIPESQYKERMQLALRTLARLALFDDAAFNKAYQVATGAMVDRSQKPSTTGFGWSVTDIGRLLVWLKIVAERDPEFAEDAAAVLSRLDFTRLVKDGYLWGEEITRTGKRQTYPEGQLGYEQYAAQGFALWGAKADKALNLTENAMPIEVMGQTVPSDKRQPDRLTSEPFVLAGLEFGWSPDMRRVARAVLAAQEERARRTGIMTIVSEDALKEPPHFFYYYCVLAKGKPVAIDVQDPDAVVDGPRWVSTKAAFGWHALLPSDYTRAAVKAVAPSRGAQGWSSGVYERTTRSSGTVNVNTAAGVMTAALYALHDEPVLARSTAAGKLPSKD
jgi:hypothetical protein